MNDIQDMKRMLALMEGADALSALPTKRRAPSTTTKRRALPTKRRLTENAEDEFSDEMSVVKHIIASIEDPAVRDSLEDELDRVGDDVGGEDDDEDFYESYGDLMKVKRRARQAAASQENKYVILHEIDDPADASKQAAWDHVRPGMHVVYSIWGGRGADMEYYAAVVTADGTGIEQIEHRTSFDE